MLAALEGDERAARVLLRRGARVELTNSYGRTALMLASCAGHASIVKLLLSVGAAVDPTDGWGRDALAWAHKRGQSHVIPLLQAAEQAQKLRQRQLVQNAKNEQLAEEVRAAILASPVAATFASSCAPTPIRAHPSLTRGCFAERLGRVSAGGAARRGEGPSRRADPLGA